MYDIKSVGNMKRFLILSFLLVCFSSCVNNNKVERLPEGSVGNLIVETSNEPKKALTEEEKVFLLQKKESERQQRDIEDLERQRYYNDKIRSYGLDD